MYPFLVHIERPATFDFPMAHPTTGVRMRAYNTSIVKIDARIENGDAKAMETWYCKTQPDAETLADYLARECPGRRVYVCKLDTVYQTPITNPIVSKMTEKGLTPK